MSESQITFRKKLADIKLDGLPEPESPDFEPAVSRRLDVDYARRGYLAKVEIADGFVSLVATRDPRLEPLKQAEELVRSGFFREGAPALEMLSDMLEAPEEMQHLCRCLSAIDRLDESVESMRRYIQENTENNHWRMALGVFLLTIGQYSQGESFLQQAYESEPNDPSVNRYLGELYADMGESEMAVEHYRRALEAQPEFPSATLGLATALEEMGDEFLSEATALYRSLIRKLGDDPIAKEAEASRTRIAYHVVRQALLGGLRKGPDHEKPISLRPDNLFFRQ